jgi:ABC-type transport system involved in cytochrome c biogenesis permease subunit
VVFESKEEEMRKIFVLLGFCLLFNQGVFASEEKDAAFIKHASLVPSETISRIAVLSHGRVKPLQSHARESLLFISGKYSMWGLDAVQWYFSIPTYKNIQNISFINIRSPELREALGFSKKDRYFSMNQLENSSLEQIAKPVMEKLSQNEKLNTEEEKSISEAVQQLFMVKSIISGENFLESITFEKTIFQEQLENGRKLLTAVFEQNADAAQKSAYQLQLKSQQYSNASVIKAEVFYNFFRPFFWSGLLYFLFGIVFIIGMVKNNSRKKLFLSLLLVPILFHAAGFFLRVWITGFAPVTNMYGTMVWVSFGVVLFGAILYALYVQNVTFGLLLVGAGSVLLLTESIPLILSPDLDPIVAVLRSNFWLTIHVLTITISYAAFTIAMLIGNSVLIKMLVGKTVTSEALKKNAHMTYRAIQLGVFLLTVGIILGGWWADYSWGRFWGWDPKETWALIADLGFLVILHAKYIGWVGPFGILAASPMAYLLVIMAWYGVNFILASGLHSYGFSSGGATIVFTLVTFQIVLFATVMIQRKLAKNK